MEFSFPEALAFGALISATDPVSTLAIFAELKVDPTLFYLVFGESVLNDAVAIVLFRTFSSFLKEGSEPITVSAAAANFVVIFCGSTLIGWVSGCCSSLLFKHIDSSHNRPTEMICFGLVMYLPFLLAEYFELSGIVSILFTGIACKHYTFRNLNARSGAAAEFMFYTMAFLTEAAVFVDLGLGVFAYTDGYNFAFIIAACLTCLVARAMHVYPLLMINNLFRGAYPITWAQMVSL